MRRARVTTVAAGLLVMLSMAACSGSDAGSSHGVAGSAGGSASDASGSGGSGQQVVRGERVAAATPSATAAPSRPATGGLAVANSAPDAAAASVRLVVGGSRIVTADLTVSVTGYQNVAVRANRAEAIATAAGGEVDADNRTAGKQAEADLVLRVPPAALVVVLRQLSGLGTEQARTLSSRDVTGQVADVTSRVASAQRAIDRLRLLYGQAQRVTDVITVEDELNSREADLESLQARQRALSAETALASIRLSLLTATTHKPAPVHHPHKAKHDNGFVAGLKHGWHAFTKAATAVLTGLGAVLPFLIVLLVLAVLGRLVWARLPRRATAPPPATPASANAGH